MSYRKSNKKRIVSLILAIVLMSGCLWGCGSGKEPQSEEKEGIRIVTTIFPEYDWVKNILGDNPAGAELTMLLDEGVDLHSFQPTADDILKISTCDLFIYVGGESDAWVDDALKEAVNKDMIVLNLLDILGDAVKEEETVEGMEAEEEEEAAGQEEEAEYDEHVWLSLKNAETIVEKITEALVRIDPDHADIYESNAEAYAGQMEELDARYQDTVSTAGTRTFLFGDRFPFRYLADDYGLTYYAAFVGCSAETEASFETVTFLAEKVDELSLPAVMTIEGTDHRIAETIVQNTEKKNQKILTMDSMQSTTKQDVEKGASYLSIMEKNLAVLKEALD